MKSTKVIKKTSAFTLREHVTRTGRKFYTISVFYPNMYPLIADIEKHFNQSCTQHSYATWRIAKKERAMETLTFAILKFGE